MSKSSVIKEKSQPSLIMVFVYGSSMAFFGVLLGVIYLMSFPFEGYADIKAQAKAMEGRETLDPIPGDAFYIEGPVSRSRSWESKRDQLVNGTAQTITVTAGEINAWFAANFRSAAKSNNDESTGLSLVPDTPNIGISEDGAIYLSVPTEITGYGLDGEYVLCARVTYSSGSPARLNIENVQVGGAAIPLPTVIGARFVSTFLDGFCKSEEFGLIREAWARVQNVEVNGNALVLTLAP